MTIEFSPAAQRASDQFLQVISSQENLANPFVQEVAERIKKLDWPKGSAQIVYRRDPDKIDLQFSKEGDLLVCKKEGGREFSYNRRPLNSNEKCSHYYQWTAPASSPSNPLRSEEKNRMHAAIGAAAGFAASSLLGFGCLGKAAATAAGVYAAAHPSLIPSLKKIGVAAAVLAGSYAVKEAAGGAIKIAEAAAGRVLSTAASVGASLGTAFLQAPGPLLPSLLAIAIPTLALMTWAEGIDIRAPEAPRKFYPRYIHYPRPRSNSNPIQINTHPIEFLTVAAITACALNTFLTPSYYSSYSYRNYRRMYWI
jgi:hypothetical protein